MPECTHGWDCPPGTACPDCLWEEAASGSNNMGPIQNKARLTMVRQALQNAVSLLCDQHHKRVVIRAAQEQSLWKAIKIAREFRQTQLAHKRHKESHHGNAG